MEENEKHLIAELIGGPSMEWLIDTIFYAKTIEELNQSWNTPIFWKVLLW